MSPAPPPVVAVAAYPPRGVADPRRAVVREIAHALKVADPSAVAAAASAMARLVPRGAALVPVPSSTGDTRANAALAAALARLVGGRVLDGLRRDPSRSQYALRAAGMPSLAASEMRLRWALRPPREPVWLVDNVVTTGATLAAAAAAVPAPAAAVVWADGSAPKANGARRRARGRRRMPPSTERTQDEAAEGRPRRPHDPHRRARAGQRGAPPPGAPARRPRGRGPGSTRSAASRGSDRAALDAARVGAQDAPHARVVAPQPRPSRSRRLAEDRPPTFRLETRP